MTPRQTLLTLLLAATLAACQSASEPGATPSPSEAATPTASPRPSPSPTPDIAGAATRRLSKLRSVRFEISGSMEIGGGKLRVEGTQAVHGRDSRLSMSIGSEANLVRIEQIVASGQSYTKVDDGVWFVGAQAPQGVADPGSTIRSLTRLLYAGPATRDGERVHRLRLPHGSTVSAETLGLPEPAFQYVQGMLDIFVKSDGTPVAMDLQVSWRQDGTVPASMTLTFEFSDLDAVATIQGPREAWITHTSERFLYSVAYPDDWEVDMDEDFDFFLGPDGTEVNVLVQEDPGTLNEWTSSTVYLWNDVYGVRPESNEPIELGGEPARLLSWHIEDDYGKAFSMVADAVHDGRGYELRWYSPPGAEVEDKERFETMLSTFAYR